MIITENQIEYGFIPHPKYKHPTNEPVLANSVFNSRLVKVLQRMMEYNCDYLFFYADREHYMNFEYLTGFSPRFEEGILILSKTGKASILLGNECYGMFKTSRIPAEGFLFQVLSLPSQDCNGIDVLKDILVEIGLNRETKVGLVGWKLMYPDYADNHVFDIPSYMVDVLREIVGNQMIFNATDWFIHPDYGFRVINTADEIAAFEYGASYASDAVDNIIRNMHSGMTEVEISTHSTCGFISQSCHPKVLLGDRTDLGMVSPTTNCAKLGDRCQITCGLRGGLTSRKGFFAYSEKDIPAEAGDFLEKIAIPYFTAAVNWYQTIGIGVTGGQMYNLVESIIPKEKYGWILNPGHLVSTEEWISSPIRKGSDIVIRSGMCFQMDIIPQAPKPYAAVNCEDGLAIADENLRDEIRMRFPDVYERMMERRDFMEKNVGIKLKEEILPLSNMSGIFRPFMLNHDMGLKVRL
jgi:Xaa-Pro aminopeptidase